MATLEQVHSRTLGNGPVELTILMPCLNENETIATCLRRARLFIDRTGISAELLVADNGSTDGSQETAAAQGARVVHVLKKGYGAALLAGIAQARGTYVIMGDADDSYDFANLDNFIEKLRSGYDLVMGNRFSGGIMPDAMPFLQ
jgi:glycosyltransferase involved in cell wall biosynthesis